MAEVLIYANGEPFIFRCRGCGGWLCKRTCGACDRKHYIHELREITNYRLTKTKETAA